jgi:2-aminoethylphosphonate-pyruvate transaminase
MIKTAVILAAGYGTRIRLSEKPKGFLNIAGRFLIDYSIQALLSNGIERIIIGTGFKHEYYERLAATYPQITLRRHERFKDSGSLFTMSNLSDLITEDFILLESDLLYDAHCIARLRGLPHANALLLSNSTNEKDGVYVQVDENNHLVHMSKEPRYVPNHADGILVGITKMSLTAYKELLDISKDELQKNPFEHYDFVFERLKQKFFVYHLPDFVFTEIDDDEQLNYALSCVYPKLTLPNHISTDRQEIMTRLEQSAHSILKENVPH